MKIYIFYDEEYCIYGVISDSVENALNILKESHAPEGEECGVEFTLEKELEIKEGEFMYFDNEDFDFDFS